MTGPISLIGVQGPQGSQGAQGPQGQQGSQGSAGAQGTQGPQGAQGLQGSQGAQGSQASVTAANIEATFTAAGQHYVGTGNGTGELLAAGSPGSRLTIAGADASLNEWSLAPDQFAGEITPIPTLIAQSVSRTQTALETQQVVLSNGDVGFVPVYLFKGQVVGHLAWCSGSTAANGPTHQWMALTDSTFHMVAATADATNAAITALDPISYAIANIASGASATYTVAADGWYFVALGLSATTTIPTQVGPSSLIGNLMAFGSSLVTFNDTTGNTAPPGFPHQFTNSGSLASRLCWMAVLQ